MSKNSDFETIKKLYGEDMAKFCRAELSTILDVDGKLPQLLQSYFAPVKGLYQLLKNAEDSGIFDKLNSNLMHDFVEERFSDENFSGEIETPEELFEKAGYDLYECNTVEDMMKFEHYYSKKHYEKICTYNDPASRLEKCRIFWAVKKNVAEIRREDFKEPKRQDEYGTSVISIQFDRANNKLSIKNRYNHSVKDGNCDATFSNCLDNIYPGLTYSFEKHYGIKQFFDKFDLALGRFIKAQDGRLYHFHTKTGNLYHCNNNIIVASRSEWDVDNATVHYYDKARYECFDNYILDIKEKRIFQHPPVIEGESVRDETLEGLKILKCSVESVKGTTNRLVKISAVGDIEIEMKIDGFGRMIEFSAENLEHIGDYFLKNSRYIEKFNAPDLKTTGSKFLQNARLIEELNIPLIEEIGAESLTSNEKIVNLSMPNLRKLGEGSLGILRELESVFVPNLEEMGGWCFQCVEKLKGFDAPKLRELPKNNLDDCANLETLNLPNLTKIGSYCLGSCRRLDVVDLPMVESVGTAVLENSNAKVVNLPRLKIAGQRFLHSTYNIKELNLPNLEKLGSNSMRIMYDLESINLPKLQKLPQFFLNQSPNLEEISAENAVYAEDSVLSNVWVRNVNLPKLVEAGREFMNKIEGLEELVLPVLKKVGNKSFMSCEYLERVVLPSLEILPYQAFLKAYEINKIYMPNLKSMEGENFPVLYKSIENINLTNLRAMENGCFNNVCGLIDTLNLPNIEYIADNCFEHTGGVSKIELPKVIEIGHNSFNNAYNPIERLRAPLLEVVGENAFADIDIHTLFAPNLRYIGQGSMRVKSYTNLDSWYLPGEVKVKMLEAKEFEIAKERVAKETEMLKDGELADISQAPQNEIINQTFRELDKVNKNTEANQAETLENQSRNGQKYELGTLEAERPRKSLFRRIFGLRRRAVAQLEEERLQEDLRNELRADLGENRVLSNRELINRRMREIYERESNRELGE